MASIEIARFTPKGQVAVPRALRKSLGIKSGTKVLMTKSGRSLLMTPLEPPEKDSFIELIRESQAFAEREGIKEDEVKKAIKAVRREKSRS
jgi:AbrB family looped-hinge helix DNA binding protein